MINQHKMMKHKKIIMILKHQLVTIFLTNKINKLIKTLKVKGKILILKIKITKTVNNNKPMMITNKQSTRKQNKVILINKLERNRRKVINKLKHLTKRLMWTRERLAASKIKKKQMKLKELMSKAERVIKMKSMNKDRLNKILMEKYLKQWRMIRK